MTVVAIGIYLLRVLPPREPKGQRSPSPVTLRSMSGFIAADWVGSMCLTVVNFGLDGEGRLYFRSERRVPKIRRIETDPHVRVCPCNFRGKPTGAVAEGRARVLAGDEEKHAYDAIAANWGRCSRPYEKLADRHLEWHGAYVEVIPA